MFTIQDLEKEKTTEANLLQYLTGKIASFKQSREYRLAMDYTTYYDGENIDINRYEKVIYDTMGKAHVDMWTANHKLASHFFTRVVDQDVSYLLGNGINFKNESTKDKLGGAEFDFRVQDVVREAEITGKAYGFWNDGELQMYKFTEFVPFYDEITGVLSAGIYFYQLSAETPLVGYFFERDGYSRFIVPKNSDAYFDKKKRGYKKKVETSPAFGVENVKYDNYSVLPIVEFYWNGNGKSEMTGKRNTINALDLSESQMVNNVDEGNLIYWVLTNYGGMDDIDLVKFKEHMKTIGVAEVNGENASASAHTLEAPFEGNQVTVDMLYKKLYTDFCGFDSTAVSASNQTATAIQATYVPLDLKADKIERYVTKFILQIMKLADITDDEPTYTRNKLINQLEEIQKLATAAPWTGDEYTTRKILTVLGDIDVFEEIQKAKMADDFQRIDIEPKGE